MTEQLDLMFERKQAANDATTALVGFLRRNGGWNTAKHIGAILCLSEREIRKAASASAGEVISAPGKSGYCHADHATADELKEVSNRLESQAKQMMARSIAIRNRAHRKIA